MKSPVKPKIQFEQRRNGCGLGCAAVGCLGFIGVVVAILIGGYMTLFHSALPLKILEAAIEEDGNVEIEGLTGDLANGFSADEFRFKTADDQWSNLTNIKFKYESDSSWLGMSRMALTEMSIDGGTIYVDWQWEGGQFDIEEDIAQEIEDEFRDEDIDSIGLREIRVDLVSIKDLKIVDPATELEIVIDEIRFENFKWRDGQIEDLGDLIVHSNQLDLETAESIEFGDLQNAKRLNGTLSAEADLRLKADVPFVIDFGLDSDFNLSFNVTLFNGQLQVGEVGDQSTLEYSNFSPTQYIQFPNNEVPLDPIDMKLKFGESWKQGPVDVEAGGSMKLGQTEFGNLQIQINETTPNLLVAEANLDGETRQAFIRVIGPFSPYWKIRLESDAINDHKQLWSQTLFGVDADQLSEEQNATVVTCMERALQKPLE